MHTSPPAEFQAFDSTVDGILASALGHATGYFPILTANASSVPSARCTYVPLAGSFSTMSDIVPGAPAFIIFVLSVTFKTSDSHPLIMGPTVTVFAF